MAAAAPTSAANSSSAITDWGFGLAAIELILRIPDGDSLYWAFSTLPQVSAALVAFIGFLALQSVLEISARCSAIEEDTRQFLLMNRHRLREGSVLSAVPVGEIRTMWGVRLMNRVLEHLSGEDTKQSNTAGSLQSYINIWQPLHDWRQRLFRVLVVFIGWNLLLMVVSLCLLPFSSGLTSVPGVGGAWVFACLSTVATTVVMVYEALFRSRP